MNLLAYSKHANAPQGHEPAHNTGTFSVFGVRRGSYSPKMGEFLPSSDLPGSDLPGSDLLGSEQRQNGASAGACKPVAGSESVPD